MIEEEDVQEDSSPQVSETITDEVPETEVAPEPTEEVKDEIEKVPEEKPDHRVPYSRIQKVTSQKRELEEEFAKYKQAHPEAPQPQTAELRRPTQEEHGYDEAKYNQALDKYDSDREKALLSNFDRLYDERTQKAQRETQLNDHNQAFSALHDSNPALAAAVREVVENEDGRVVYTDTTRSVIASVPNSAELEAYLTINRHEVLPQLEGMTPMAQMMELGRISAEISTSQTKPKVQDKPISRAPEPIEASGGGSTFINEDAARKAKDKTYRIY